jgi:hypothetical protein
VKQESSTQNKDQSLERLSNFVNKFSFPRLAGTEGEKKAVNLTIKTFQEIGFDSAQILHYRNVYSRSNDHCCFIDY